ncbi:hypothetical protein SAMCCGM7_pC0367 (plasmid) [Sinorhizobium americanum CCGM7]|nr:hypothetical protein SAMCCGM7_pC0367 [Sinorhizobium americanum CCGM7]
MYDHRTCSGGSFRRFGEGGRARSYSNSAPCPSARLLLLPRLRQLASRLSCVRLSGGAQDMERAFHFKFDGMNICFDRGRG